MDFTKLLDSVKESFVAAKTAISNAVAEYTIGGTKAIVRQISNAYWKYIGSTAEDISTLIVGVIDDAVTSPDAPEALEKLLAAGEKVAKNLETNPEFVSAKKRIQDIVRRFETVTPYVHFSDADFDKLDAAAYLKEYQKEELEAKLNHIRSNALADCAGKSQEEVAAILSAAQKEIVTLREASTIKE